MKEIQVNMAYHWFLGLDMVKVVPHFTTFGKNFERRFKGTDLFEQILLQCVQAKLVDPLRSYSLIEPTLKPMQTTISSQT
ncbi:transposase [Lentilactobacillus kefiri]|nr:hypothetical protein B8W85_12570 [Lentilactobacillus kefiri]